MVSMDAYDSINKGGVGINDDMGHCFGTRKWLRLVTVGSII
jgi:hypothetical protein